MITLCKDCPMFMDEEDCITYCDKGFDVSLKLLSDGSVQYISKDCNIDEIHIAKTTRFYYGARYQEDKDECGIHRPIKSELKIKKPKKVIKSKKQKELDRIMLKMNEKLAEQMFYGGKENE